MTIEVTINLDSGCFLPRLELKKGYCTEVGYFQNLGEVPDIRVFVDGDEKPYDPALKLGSSNSTIEVRHMNSDGSVRRDGTNTAATFHKQLLHMKDLYDVDIEMDRSKFDCVFRFESGRFLPSMIKTRAFKESRKGRDGFAATGNRKDVRPVSHNVIIHYTLKKGEWLEVASDDGKIFLSSKHLKVKKRLEIELPVDNSVGNKFYHDAFKVPRTDGLYWLPNECDPPPSCPFPPCDPTLGG